MKASKTGRTSVLGMCLVACASTAQHADGPQGAGIERRDISIVHEPCDHEDDAAVARDANRDGKPDIITVMQDNKPVCQWLDLNFDGVVDAWVYYDQNAQVRRRETDLDRDGKIDEIAVFKAGQMESRKRATTLAGRIDTWEHFENGVLRRAERDADGNQMIDQWWEYSRPRRQDCPVVHTDVDGDGRPDPGATVDLCEDELSENQTEDADRPPQPQGLSEGQGTPQSGASPLPQDDTTNAVPSSTQEAP